MNKVLRLVCPIPVLLLLAACGSNPDSTAWETSTSQNVLKVTGELRSSRPRYFSPPSIDGIWHYTIASLAPDGGRVQKGMPILRFDTQELTEKLQDKQNSLNEKQKELQKQEVLGREILAEGRLAVEEARALKDKAVLKAEIPETLLAYREYRENQLLLKQAELSLALKKAELKADMRIQETEADILRKEIAVLHAEVSHLEQSIDLMTIRAPRDGVVIHVMQRSGDKPAVGDNIWGGRRVLGFPDLTRIELHLEIPERDSARIALGQSVSFTLDAAPEHEFTGQVSELAAIMHTRSRSQPAKVFDAIVAIDEPDPDLMRPGMSVNAEIQARPTGKDGP